MFQVTLIWHMCDTVVLKGRFSMNIDISLYCYSCGYQIPLVYIIHKIKPLVYCMKSWVDTVVDKKLFSIIYATYVCTPGLY